MHPRGNLEASLLIQNVPDLCTLVVAGNVNKQFGGSFKYTILAGNLSRQDGVYDDNILILGN